MFREHIIRRNPSFLRRYMSEVNIVEETVVPCEEKTVPCQCCCNKRGNIVFQTVAALVITGAISFFLFSLLNYITEVDKFIN